MKDLLKVLELIQRIENFTLEKKYHSKFHFVDENNLEIDCYCWNHAAGLKVIFDDKSHMVIYIENTKLRIISLI